MRCPKCGFNQQDSNIECLACGIIFQKYLSRAQNKTDTSSDETSKELSSKEVPTGLSESIKNLFFYVQPENNPLIVWGRVIFFAVILVWGIKFILTPIQSGYAIKSFWHLVNLPFHEAGHIIFRPFGRFMTSLGGSLGQLLMPLICMIVFLLKTRDTFAASFGLWWLGENFIDLAPYVYDAKARTMPLLGGNTGRTSPYGFHDWEFILKESGLINYYHGIASAFHRIGIIIMVLSFIWGGYILFRQLKLIKSKG